MIQLKVLNFQLSIIVCGCVPATKHESKWIEFGRRIELFLSAVHMCIYELLGVAIKLSCECLRTSGCESGVICSSESLDRSSYHLRSHIITYIRVFTTISSSCVYFIIYLLTATRRVKILYIQYTHRIHAIYFYSNCFYLCSLFFKHIFFAYS